MAKRGVRRPIPDGPRRKTTKRPKVVRPVLWPYKRDRSKEKRIKPGEKPQYPPIYGQQGQPQQPQQIPAQPQRGWTAQPVQQQPAQQQVQQPQQPQQPVGGLWRAMIIIILIILAIIFLSNILPNILPDFGTLGGSNCITTCTGYAVVQAPGCDCPPNSYLSPTTPYAYKGAGCEKGCKQCICR